MGTVKRRRPLGWWVLSLLIAGGVWFLSSRGSTPLPTPHPLDWAAHFLTYLALGFCLSRATGSWTAALVLAAWFGALDEVHQAFVPPREAGITDWWFDLAGAALGARLAAGKSERAEAAPQVDMEFEEVSGKW